MYNYFPHPSNLRQTSGVVSLLIEEGFAGYGIYVAVLEVLRDAPEYKYNPDPKVLAFLLHAPDVKQVERVLGNYGLFDKDDNGLLYSPWLSEQMGAYSDRKAKLQEAGRRGAARRWAGTSLGDGQAIATPSLGDGQAIAHNNTLSNVTLHNETLPNPTGGGRISDGFVSYIIETEEDGHNAGYVAQELRRLGCSVETFQAIRDASDGCNLTHPTYKRFCAEIKRIAAEKWTPKVPDAFIIKKVIEA